MTLRAVELFAGGGGLALGAEEAGFSHVALLEWYGPACETLRRRDGWRDAVVEGDVKQVYDDFATTWKGVDLIAGGPPCQPFSMAGRRLGEEDPRNMFPHAVRAVDQARPRAFLFENVKGLRTWRDPEDGSLYFEDKVVGPLRELGYAVDMRLLNAADWGVPQKRERVFTVGFRASLNARWEWPAPTHSKDALFFSQWVDPGPYWREHGLPRPDVPTPFVERAERMRPPPLPRWRTVRDAIAGLPPRPPDEPVDEKGVYQTHDPDEPATTVTATHRNNKRLRMDDGRSRYFTARELARLQAFPDAWPFAGSEEEQTIQIGNAVPPPMARVLMKAMADVLAIQGGA